MSKINIFLSSAMNGELDDERNSIFQLFSENEIIKNFYNLYTIEKSASTNKIEKAFLSEVSKADIVVCLFKKDLRIPVKKEYEKAREEGKKVFIYLYEDSSERNEDLNLFIKEEIYKYDPGFFNSTYRLLENLKKDINEDIISTYRSTIGNNDFDVFRQEVNTSFSYYRFYDPATIENNKAKFKDFDINQFILLVEEIRDQQGNYKSALLIAEIGLHYYPNDWKLYNNRGILLEEMGLKEYAFHSYNKALEFNNNEETLLYNIGNYYYEKRNYSIAITYYSKSIAKNNKKINSLNKLSLSFRGNGDKSKYLEYSRRTFEIDNSEMYAINYSIALADNGIISESFEILEKYLDENNKRYINAKAYLYWVQKDTKKIIELLEYGEMIDNREIALVLIESYLIENQLSKAQRSLKIISKNLVYTDFDYNNIGFLFGKYNLYDEANNYLRKAIDINPLFVEPVITLIANLANSKQYNKALEECEKALVKFPFEPKLIRNKYLIYYYQGQLKEGLMFLFKKTFTVTGLDDQIPEGLFDNIFNNI